MGKKKREEERRIIAELEEALAQEKAANGEEEVSDLGREARCEEQRRTKESFYSSTQPKNLHCRRCKTEMQEGKCPVCGYTVYTGMAEAKRKKIRGVLTVVCVAIFLLLFFLLR